MRVAMTSKRKLWVLVITAILLSVAISYAANPLRWSDEALHQWLLKKVPVGSDLDHLKAVADRKGWQIWAIWKGRPQPYWAKIDGDTIVWIYLGGYRSVFQTELDSFWAFDESGRLIDVHTRRMADAP